MDQSHIQIKNIELPFILDLNTIGSPEVGYLTIFENIMDIKRAYWGYSIPAEVKRGFHAHKSLRQYVIALKGTIKVRLEGLSYDSRQFELSTPNQALFIPSGCWREIEYLQDAIMLCLASEEYRENDYIRDYSKFLEFKTEAGSKWS